MLESDTGQTIMCELKNVLSFFTGAESIPTLGFARVTLTFNSKSIFPTASTCALELTLPTTHHADYNTFNPLHPSVRAFT